MEKLRSIFNFIYGYYLDYRYKVPPASALSFAYYMILSIIPICTLLAFFTPFFPLDLKTAQEILSYYLRPDVTKMVIQLIKPRSLSITTITTLIASIFVVSRGFYQLHRISKNMFPNDKEYPFFIDLTGSSGANAPETAPTKQDFASSTPSISPPLEST